MPTQSEIAAKLGLPIHPPKVEIFDLESRTNTDPKQCVRAVDTYRVEPFGLYMARPMPGHPKMDYLESWLLPELGIRATDFRFKPGHERDQDYYLDVVSIERGRKRWCSTDLYLDISVGTGRFAEVVDIDEFLTALRADLIDEPTANRAMEASHAAVEGLARNNYDLSRWLSEYGITLSWQGVCSQTRPPQLQR